MRLEKAASFFNNTPCADAYTGDFVFKGQFAPYDEAKRDAVVTERRILSLSPTAVVPPRRAITAAGVDYIIGNQGTPDQFQGRTIRVGYVAQRAPYLVQCRTLGQACRNEPGVTARGNRDWVKNLAFIAQSSELPEQIHITLAVGEPVVSTMLLDLGPSRYLVRQVVEESPTGMLVALCDEQPDAALGVVTVQGGVYDPRLDRMTASTQTVQAVRLRWQSFFVYGNKAAPEFGPTDVQFVFDRAVNIVEGQKVEAPDGVWQLDSVLDMGDFWLCRGVQHG